ncbi:hypothetical protein CRG98_016527 [Punica granatum]|uniref:Reverse transcriptase Ty1/copia-type domain-containing protein n=1 Tax=Punica granatum TaxID=22663 RepID=A0A2I0K5U9_PUNGR|nr:hypothetical protein CRG98_016527 [Punica granatum]
MKDELDSMAKNEVWDLVELPERAIAIGCKWAKLVTKGFTQMEGIDYHETFFPVSKKDLLRIIMALVAHMDLELHRMDVKTAFLIRDLDEEVYMK